MVDLIKLCVGVTSIEQLAAWQTMRMEAAGPDPGPMAVSITTRNMPRRADEVLDGGSLYWVVQGFVAVRQRIVAMEREIDSDGRPRCRIGLEPMLVALESRRCRPFQGWRYLKPDRRPPDQRRAANNAPPPEMAAELREMGLI